ncbi:type VII secretion protein EsaA [Acetobacter orientalis]|uniref:Type VII secretion protein EsaA n=1 Tax=Acetobacter orientalis TaxID=146474 RepID=A0A2Z5ZE59_9PROT|nr:type VII secretion protein EsaA [Acetobacter orientalis]
MPPIAKLIVSGMTSLLKSFCPIYYTPTPIFKGIFYFGISSLLLAK